MGSPVPPVGAGLVRRTRVLGGDKHFTVNTDLERNKKGGLPLFRLDPEPRLRVPTSVSGSEVNWNAFRENLRLWSVRETNWEAPRSLSLSSKQLWVNEMTLNPS